MLPSRSPKLDHDKTVNFYALADLNHNRGHVDVSGTRVVNMINVKRIHVHACTDGKYQLSQIYIYVSSCK